MKRINIITSKSGQAVVEYILLILIIVLVSTGLLYQFNRGFRSYVNIFFGEYIKCLIESGELPVLGGSTSNNCEKPKFSFTPEEIDPIGSGNVGGSATGVKSDNTNPKVPMSSKIATSGGSGIGSTSTNNQVPISEAGISDSSEGEISDTSGGRSLRVPISDSTSDIDGDDENQNFTAGRQRVVPLTRSDMDVEDKLNNNQVESSDQIGQTRLVPISQSSTSESMDEQSEEGFNLASLIRFLFIFGIIIAIAVLLFMQAIQIKKALEK